jgi:outer membrane usher protein
MPTVVPPASRKVLRVLLPLFFLFLFPPVLRAQPFEPIVVAVLLNGQPKGEVFALRTPEGDFFLKAADLRKMGLGDLPGEAIVLDGEPHLSLRSLKGAEFSFDERTLALSLTLPPELFPPQTLDFLPPRRTDVYYPRDTSAFLNYGVGYTAGDSFSFRERDASLQLGGRHREFLFLTDFSFTETREEENFVRLQTSLSRDRRETLEQTVLGDFFADSGELGASLQLGGISYSKVYRIDPYLQRYPLGGFASVAKYPSEIEVYLDGTLIRKERVGPGEFELSNLSYYGGAREVSVLIRDPFGTVQKLEYPFYFTDLLLRKGLHEYSYNLGFLRENFGTESNDYGDLAFSLFHRYGVNDRLTAGVRGEGTPDGVNGGLFVSYMFPRAGVTSLSVSGSYAESGGGGAAAVFRHEYLDRRFSGRFFLKGFTKDYFRIAQGGTADPDRYAAGLSLGYGSPRFGSLTLDASATGRYQGPDRKQAGASYSRNLSRRTRLLVSYRRIEEETASDEFFLGLTWYPLYEVTLSGNFEKREDEEVASVQAQKSAPVGEGFGARVTAERRDRPQDTVTTFDSFLQWNSRYAILTGEYLGVSGDLSNEQTWRATAAGGIGYVGGTFGFTRPIRDSFGLVTVDGVKGVRVFRNGQEVGRTDRKGRAFVPELGSYIENQVSIADKDVPLDYSLAEVVRYVNPPFRSGSVIAFEATRFQAFTGSLWSVSAGVKKPLEFGEGKISGQGREFDFFTGKGGELYLENVPAGSFEGTVAIGEASYRFRLEIPRSDEIIVDLGEILCEAIP